MTSNNTINSNGFSLELKFLVKKSSISKMQICWEHLNIYNFIKGNRISQEHSDCGLDNGVYKISAYGIFWISCLLTYFERHNEMVDIRMKYEIFRNFRFTK